MNSASHSQQPDQPAFLQSDDAEELAYLEQRDQVCDEELTARMLAASDCGGRLLVELSEFVARRNPRGPGS